MIACLISFSAMSAQTTLAAGEGSDDAINEDYANQKSLQPIAPAFSVESLLEWSPDTDPDSALNRASVPLNEKRFKGHQINPLAHPEVGITAASITTTDHDTSSTVGSNDFNVYAFDHWQLLTSYIYWPGAENKEGIFALPSPDIVDAAHRNGVPVYASLGFPWGEGSPEVLEEIEAFTEQKDDGSFPVADKMIEVAKYYGFDGYFFNQETSGVTKETAERMNDMMRYIKRNSELNVSWYDSQANDGKISYQDSINEKNDMYVKPAKDGVYAVDEFFLNYNWNDKKIDTTVSTMDKHNRSPYDAYAGFELQQNSHHTKIDTDALLDDKKQSKVSIALYTPNSTMGLADDPADFHEQENYLWTGPQGDPSKADDAEDWKGMARFASDSSVIQTKPFTTNFNSGHGKKYFADGKEVSGEEWNNRSLQDIMPTWRWWNRGDGTKLDAAYDFDDAFNGGNALKFSGDLEAGSENDIMLYSTKLPVESSTKVRVVYKNKPGAKVALGVSYEEDYDQEAMTYYELPDSGEAWETTEVDLGEQEGKTAYALSLQVKNEEAVDDYSLQVGQLSVFDKEEKPAAPEAVKVEEKLMKSAMEAEARLSWKEQEGIRYYEVYQENAKGDTAFLGATPNHHFYTSNISRTEKNAAKENKTTIKVVPVNDSYVRGKAEKVSFDWGMDIDATEKETNPPSENLAQNANITDVSEENTAEAAAKALDGSSNSKWAATDATKGHLSIDLGEEQTIRRWRVEHAEYGGETKDMNTIDFELLYKDKSGEWQSAKRIKDNEEAVTDIVLDEPVTAQEFELQIHNSGASPWGAIRIYEWQLFESDQLPKTENVMMHFVEAINKEGATDTVVMEQIEKDQVVRLYESLDAKEPLAETTVKEDGKVEWDELDFGEDAGRIYYTVQTPKFDESLRYSAAYLSENLEVTDLQRQVQLMELKGVFLDTDAAGKLQKHLTAVKHFAEQEKNEKVVKHLQGFQTLVQEQEKNHMITKEAATKLLEQTEEVISKY